MRHSYTSGIQAKGEVTKKLNYTVMLGNNMSTLGVDAGQLDAKLNTLSAGLIYLPTTGEYGMFNGSYGDYDNHQKVATRFGGHFTRSNETRQGQPTSDAFENTTLRVSDGSSIFAPNLFVEGLQIQEARDMMVSLDGGAKLKGYALEGEYYWRKIDKFYTTEVNPGPSLPFDKLNDNGFQLLASAMVFPKKLQVYTTYSRIFGQYGNPSEVRTGLNFFPFKHTISARINAQLIFMKQCPV